MMGCECITPPPEFDVPPPPDPSLIWHLLSDEPPDELTQIQQCDAAAASDREVSSHSEVSSVLSNLPNYLLHAFLASGALISAALIVIIICMRIRRFSKKRLARVKRKPEYSADVVLSSSEWPYTRTIRNDSSSVINGDILYGSTGNEFIIHKAVPVTPNSLRSYPCRPNNLSITPMRNNSLRQSATMLRLRGCADGYCTVGRLYDEIPENGIFDSAQPGHTVVYAPRRELIYGVSSVRKPPPSCRPPPPPTQDSPLSLDSSGNSVDKELDVIHSGSSPKRSTDDEKSRNSGNSGDNGRESGYGTAPSRLWNSPAITHQQRVPSRHPEDVVRRQGVPAPPALAVYAHHSNSAHHPMTYV